MGQKVHPYGFRLGYTKTWNSRWFAKQGYAALLQEDLRLKATLRQKLRPAGISSIELDRPGNKLRVTIRTARPGIVIGRRGAEIEKLKQEVQERTKREVYIDIQEVHRPELDAQLVSESVALQIEKRVAFRRAMRKAVDSALRFGCKGIKIWVAGRLNGKEIARTEWYLQGRLPLQTLRADIDYGFTEAHTTYGVLGVKCWIYRGEILGHRAAALSSGGPQAEPEPARRGEARSAAERERDRIRAARTIDRSRQETAPAATPVAAAPAAPPAEASESSAGTPLLQPPLSVSVPVAEPPVTEPPAVDPPAVDPPAVDPPAVDPPAVGETATAESAPSDGGEADAKPEEGSSE